MKPTFIPTFIFICSVRDSVQKMMDSIAKDVSVQGPSALMHYFENGATFFMASDGQLQFPDIDSATHFINHTLLKTISKIDLR